MRRQASVVEQVQQLALAPLLLAEATEEEDLVDGLAAPRAPEAPPAEAPWRPPGAVPLPGMSPSKVERKVEAPGPAEGYASKPVALRGAKRGSQLVVL